MKIEIEVPDALHENTRDLVSRFAGALAAKLRKAEVKYGYADGWAEPAKVTSSWTATRASCATSRGRRARPSRR